MSIWLIVLLAVLCVLLAGGALFSYKMAAYVAKPSYHATAETIADLKGRGLWRDFDELEKEELTISSYDGYILHATYIPAEVPGGKYVVISHGYTCNRMNSVKYVHLFRDMGYNCLVYDNRSHGDNRRGICTLGKRESGDLLQVIRYMYRRFGDDIYLGLHGESMGSALQILALKEKPDVRFVVNDCGFSRLMGVMKHKIRTDFGLPAWLCYPVELVSACFFGFTYTEVRPVDSLKDNQVPICFIHGAEDNFIPCSHSEEMHAATAGYSELHLFPDTDHAMSIESDEARYRQIVADFLEEVARREKAGA